MMHVNIPDNGFQALHDQDSLLVLEKTSDVSGIGFWEREVDTFLVLLVDPMSALDNPVIIGLRIRCLQSLVSDLERATRRPFFWTTTGLDTLLNDLIGLVYPGNMSGEAVAMYRLAREIGVFTDSFTLASDEEPRRKTA